MKLKLLKKSLFIGELTFGINTNLIEKYLQLDYEIWVSESNPEEITSIIYWTDYKYYKNIDKNWLNDRKKKCLS
ncbi:hypothetical protein IM33_15900 [Clostridioides difficile]|nr:hypothetical protein IM33_15900 [Clostridioides difficile]